MSRLILSITSLALTYIIISIIQDGANYDILFLGFAMLFAGWVSRGDAE